MDEQNLAEVEAEGKKQSQKGAKSLGKAKGKGFGKRAFRSVKSLEKDVRSLTTKTRKATNSNKDRIRKLDKTVSNLKHMMKK